MEFNFFFIFYNKGWLEDLQHKRAFNFHYKTEEKNIRKQNVRKYFFHEGYISLENIICLFSVAEACQGNFTFPNRKSRI